VRSASELARALEDPRAPHGLRLSALHELNGRLAQEPTIERLVEVSEVIPEGAVRAVLDVVSSGEPHAHVAVTFLHFLAFSRKARRVLQSCGTLPLLVGLLTARGAEYELEFSSLSLLVTLAEADTDAGAELGRTRGTANVAAAHISRGEEECRELGRRLARSLLGSPEGRRQCLKSGRLRSAVAAAAEAAPNADAPKMVPPSPLSHLTSAATPSPVSVSFVISPPQRVLLKELNLYAEREHARAATT